MRFIDLFSGLGGFHLAASKLGGNCVFASEIDTRLQSLYEENFGILPHGDIRKVDVEDIPKHDLLCAGFPCQPFSKAGSQEGFNDPIRGTLFYEIIEILKHHKPEYIILENVAHFVKHDSGSTYEYIKTHLENLGYQIKSHKLSPHQFGIPQIRERMYLVGRRGSLENFYWPTPQTTSADLCIKEFLDKSPEEAKKIPKQVFDCLVTWQDFLERYPAEEQLPSFPIWSMEFGATYPFQRDNIYSYSLNYLRKLRGSFGQHLRCRTNEELFELLPSYASRPEKCFPKWKVNFIKQNRSLYNKNQDWIEEWISSIQRFPASYQKLEWNCKGEERNIWNYIIQFRASGVRVKRPTTSPSLVAMTTTQVPIIAWEERYMTVKECARLQSLDELKLLPNHNMTIKALGNAVNVTVVALVLESLYETV